MRNLIFIVSVFAINTVFSEPVCHKCEEIREYNRTHKETDFIYYEDYLKDKEEKAKQNSSQNQSKEENAPQENK